MYCRPLRKCAVPAPVFQYSWKGSVAETENQAKYRWEICPSANPTTEISNSYYSSAQKIRILGAFQIIENISENLRQKQKILRVLVIYWKWKDFQWCQNDLIFSTVSDQHYEWVTQDELIIKKKRDPRIPVPPFFGTNLEKYSKGYIFHVFFKKRPNKFWKFSWKFGKILW